jgi:hypothetical protein
MINDGIAQLIFFAKKPPKSGLGSPHLQAWGGEVGQSDEGGLDDQLLP